MSKTMQDASAAHKIACEAWMMHFIRSDAHRVVFASAGQDDDGAQCALELAELLSAAGARVLVVDCDLRRCPLQARLSRCAPTAQSLAAALCAAPGTMPSVVPIHGFHAVAAGKPDRMVSALLASARMEELLHRLGAPYDYMLCIAPPVTAAPDAAVLGSRCDGVVLTVRHRRTRRHTVAEAAEALHHGGAKLLGTVLTEYDLTMARKMGEPYVYDGKS